MNPSHALAIQDLTAAYQKKPVLWNITFQVPQGAIAAIVGPNGAGKSTLLKVVLGLMPALHGRVAFFGQSLESYRQKIAYVPQRDSVDWNFPTTVFDVALMGRYGHLGWLRRPGQKDRDITLAALEQVGMKSLAHRALSDLSGGQRQRVFLARALAQEAELYFLDEPFAGIDVATEQTIIQLLQNLGRQGKTIFVVHHDIHTVKDSFNWLILLNTHLIASGSLRETFTRSNLERTYGGRLTILDQVQELIEKDPVHDVHGAAVKQTDQSHSIRRENHQSHVPLIPRS